MKKLVLLTCMICFVLFGCQEEEIDIPISEIENAKRPLPDEGQDPPQVEPAPIITQLSKSQNTITVNFTTQYSATKFEILMSTSSTFSNPIRKFVNGIPRVAQDVNFTNIPEKVRHYFKIRAVEYFDYNDPNNVMAIKSGWSATSDIVSYETAPPVITSINKSASSVTIKFTSEGLETYDIDISPKSNFSETVSHFSRSHTGSDDATQEFTFPSVPGAVYHIRIRGSKDLGPGILTKYRKDKISLRNLFPHVPNPENCEYRLYPYGKALWRFGPVLTTELQDMFPDGDKLSIEYSIDHRNVSSIEDTNGITTSKTVIFERHSSYEQIRIRYHYEGYAVSNWSSYFKYISYRNIN